MFALDGAPPDETEVSAYLAMLGRAKEDHLPLQGVMLYGLARSSLQVEAVRLNPLPESWLRDLGERISALGFSLRLTP
jgi:hypothetical protein